METLSSSVNSLVTLVREEFLQLISGAPVTEQTLKHTRRLVDTLHACATQLTLSGVQGIAVSTHVPSNCSLFVFCCQWRARMAHTSTPLCVTSAVKHTLPLLADALLADAKALVKVRHDHVLLLPKLESLEAQLTRLDALVRR